MDFGELTRFDLKWPGRWIAGSDRDAAFEIVQLLHSVETEYESAVAAWAMFRPWTADRVAAQEGWPPTKYGGWLNTIYARSFVFSLDMIQKLLSVVAKYRGIPDAASKAIADCCADCVLKHIRDSIAHLEDRSRGVDRNQKMLRSSMVVWIRSSVAAIISLGATADGMRWIFPRAR